MSWITIDVGNTRIKFGLWKDEYLPEVSVYQTVDQLATEFQHAWKDLPTIVSSVRSENETKKIMELFPSAISFSQLSSYPVQIDYSTPETLGADRLANAIAVSQYASKSQLIVDLGTCLKFDFVSNGCYKGGAISPGLAMRFKAMHEYTGKLPLITAVDASVPLVGNSTLSSMSSGVIHGMTQEILGICAEYAKITPELTIFLTGGDVEHFDIPLKNNIFVDENLTLRGLLIALKHAQS